MSSVRSRGLSRGWYPATASSCMERIKEFISGFQPPLGKWSGGIAPHAGWDFSGRGAARVFATLASAAKPDRVVVYGGHLSASGSPIIYTEDNWETPLGVVPVDSSSVRDFVKQGLAVSAPPSYSDNTVEVLLPFVKYFFPDALLVAVHSPASEKAIELGEAIAEYFGTVNLTTVYLGSADLTHYGPNYGFMPVGSGLKAVQWVKEHNDRSLIETALAMDAHGVLREAPNKQNTCSPGPVASVIASMSVTRCEKGTLLDYYTSYEVVPGSSFVGYASIVY